MSKYALDSLEEKLCKELDEIANKTELGAGDLEIAHKLTDTLKNIYKIDMYTGEDGEYIRSGDKYSRAGEWEADMRGTYGRGSSYANRGKHYVRGHYSRTDGRERMRERIEDMMRDADDDKLRNALQRCLNEL